MRQVAIYGKGGVFWVAVDLPIVTELAESGKKVLVVGCDPKADSIRPLIHRLY